MFRIDGKYIKNNIIEKYTNEDNENTNIYNPDKITKYNLIEIPININYDNLNSDEKNKMKETIIKTISDTYGFPRESCEVSVERIVNEENITQNFSDVNNSRFILSIKIKNLKDEIDESIIIKKISSLNIDNLDYQSIGEFNKDSHSNVCVDDICLTIEQLSRLKSELKKYKCLIPK